jgi:DNA helicase HerA-like ATPase
MLDFLSSSRRGWRLPGLQDRTSIVGKTGSGKTTAGLFILSEMDLHKFPWIILDYKGDDIIDRIPAIPLKVLSEPPTEPGLYKLECSPFLAREDPVEGFLKKVWRNGGTGLFFDEAYMLPDRYGRTEGGTLRALFTTGRSRRIPIISLSQRPLDVTKYNFSEASHHVIFRLPDKADRDIVRGRVPNEEFDRIFGKYGTGLPEFHSMWYDVTRDNVFQMLPFPHPDEVVERLQYVAKINRWK